MQYSSFEVQGYRWSPAAGHGTRACRALCRIGTAHTASNCQVRVPYSEMGTQAAYPHRNIRLRLMMRMYTSTRPKRNMARCPVASSTHQEHWRRSFFSPSLSSIPKAMPMEVRSSAAAPILCACLLHRLIPDQTVVEFGTCGSSDWGSQDKIHMIGLAD